MRFSTNRWSSGWAIVCVALCAMCWLVVSLERSCPAAEPKPPADKPAEIKKSPPGSSNLDDALLDDLNNDLLEGAGDLKDRPRKKVVDPAGSTDKPAEQPPIDGEDVGMAGEDDPLAYIGQEMQELEGIITQSAKRIRTEQLQQRVIEDLSKLIEQAQQQRSAQQSASQKDKKQQSGKRQTVKQSKSKSAGSPGKDSNKPARDSTDRMGKAEDARADPELVKGMMKDTWGHLPQRAREEMLQNSPERFLPQYELLIERYYKRLAEEQNSK